MRGLQTSALAMDAFEVKVPSMGESITEGTIANVLKKPGVWGGRQQERRRGWHDGGPVRWALLPRLPVTCMRMASNHLYDWILSSLPGDAVKEDDIIAQIETDKVSTGLGRGHTRCTQLGMLSPQSSQH
jgi:hypothetical protein